MRAVVNTIEGNLDHASETVLNLLAEQQKIKQNRLPGVKTVLVVLSGVGMVFDIEALRQKIRLAYPDSVVYFCTPRLKPMGQSIPKSVDLLVDFTSSSDREIIFLAKKLRRLARVAVGRDISFLRRKLYDRVLNEKLFSTTKTNLRMHQECVIQKEVLALAGIPFAQQGDSAPNIESTIASSFSFPS